MTKPSIVTATEANRNFSGVLDRVKRGEVIDITSHGKAVATIQPKLDEAERQRKRSALDAHMDRLRQQEFKAVGPWSRSELYERD